MSKLFKTHNTLGKPLCQCCGSNPRNPDWLKCGRCDRERRPVQWDRVEAGLKAELMVKFGGDSNQPDVVEDVIDELIQSWNRWEAEANQQAQQDQDYESYRWQMAEYLRPVLAKLRG